LNDEASLANTKPFIDWGLSNTASALLDETPLLELSLEQRTEMKARLGVRDMTEFAPKLPTRAPNLKNCVDEPLIAVDYNCGLLNLNFLCLRGCGFFRRLLGFCEDYVEVPITVTCP
jgi:hypothetical protein